MRAMWNAARNTAGSSAADLTRKLCLVIGTVMPVISVSWKASRPNTALDTWPVMATSGVESIQASEIGVTRFVAPGPLVATHTPTRPVARA